MNMLASCQVLFSSKIIINCFIFADDGIVWLDRAQLIYHTDSQSSRFRVSSLLSFPFLECNEPSFHVNFCQGAYHHCLSPRCVKWCKSSFFLVTCQVHMKCPCWFEVLTTSIDGSMWTNIRCRGMWPHPEKSIWVTLWRKKVNTNTKI